MAKTKGPAVIIKKKRWVTVIAPKLFNEKEMGELYVTEPQVAIGRKIAVSLMTLTGDPQKQNINTRFTITSYIGDRLTTEMESWSITPSASKKLMRRNRSKIEDSFVVTTSDNKKLRIKPLLITRSRATGGTMATLRKELKSRVEKAVAKDSFEQFIKDVVMKKFQRTLSDGLKKIHPVAIIEIKKFFVIEDKK